MVKIVAVVKAYLWGNYRPFMVGVSLPALGALRTVSEEFGGIQRPVNLCLCVCLTLNYRC